MARRYTTTNAWVSAALRRPLGVSKFARVGSIPSALSLLPRLPPRPLPPQLYDRTVAVRSQLATVLASLIDAGLPRDPPTTPAVVAMEEADNDSGAGGNIEPKLESGGAVVGGGGDGGGGGGSGGGGAVVGGGGDGGGGGGSGGGGGGGGKMTLYLEPFRAELVSLLMNLLADDSPVVCEEAGRLLEELGEVRGPGGRGA